MGKKRPDPDQLGEVSKRVSELERQVLTVENLLLEQRMKCAIQEMALGSASRTLLVLLTSMDPKTGLWPVGTFDGADPSKPFESIQNAMSLLAKALAFRGPIP